MRGSDPDEGRATGGGRQAGFREVLVVGGAVVLVVLAAALLTAFLPAGIQSMVFHTPLLIGVLMVGTAFVLWRLLRRPAP